MNRAVGLSLVFVAFAPAAAGAQNCARPAVTAVSVSGVTHTPYLDLYHVRATVTNLTNQPQAGNVLQFVDVVQYDARLDDRGVPPLAPGESYTITYVWPRSADAGKLTSPLNFRIRSVEPAECVQGGGSAGITV